MLKMNSWNTRLPLAMALALLVTCASRSSAQGTVFYVRAGATGAQNGSSWTDAFPRLPSTFVRGATYYVGSGGYAGATFSTAASGTQTITIKGATVADHGASTGWSPSFSVSTADGGSQAIWTSSLTFSSSYWIFDGTTGPVNSRTKTDYGFMVKPIDNAIQIFNLSSAMQNVTISHVTATAQSGDVEKMFLVTSNSTQSVHNVTLSHCLLDGWENSVWATSAGLPMNNWLVEYNIILNGFSSATWHGEDINNNYGNLANLVIRYNWFENRSSGTGTIVVLNGAGGPYYIYGNVFKNQTAGDGTIAGVHFNVQAFIYNNIFANLGGGAWVGDSVTGEAYNNIFYNTNAGLGSGTSVTHDYNAFFSTTSTPTETHRYTASGSPFVDYTNDDLRITSAIAATMPAGMTLASPYNLDMLGLARGADGTWDRGVFEFNGTGGSTAAPTAPTNLRIVP